MHYNKMSITKYVKELSSAKPVPGGGSAAALVGTLGIALSSMVVQITMKKASPAKQKELKRYLKELQRIMQATRILIDKDARTYRMVIMSYKLPRSQPRRAQRVQKSLFASFTVMKELCSYLLRAHAINRKIFRLSHGAILNDVCVSQVFLHAALSSAVATASLNAEYITSKKRRKKLLDQIQKINEQKRKR